MTPRGQRQQASSRRKLTFEQAESIRRRFIRGELIPDLAREFDMNYTSIQQLISGQSYRAPDRTVAPPPAPPVVPPDEATARYRQEKAKREERRQQSPEMRAARAAFEAQLERDRAFRKGGRPKKAGDGFRVGSKPGKPQIAAHRSHSADALIDSLAPFRGA